MCAGVCAGVFGCIRAGVVLFNGVLMGVLNNKFGQLISNFVII